MSKWCAFILTVVGIVGSTVQESVLESVCGVDHAVSGESSVSFHSKRNESGEWVTTISAYHDAEGSPEIPNLDVKRRIISCGGKEIVHVKAIMRGLTKQPVDNVGAHSLLFQEKGGKNAVVSYDRRTVNRKNEETERGYAGILTNHHLKNNELFEVNLDRVIAKHSYSLRIGVTTLSPTDIQYEEWLISGVIRLVGSSMIHNGSTVKTNYGPNLLTLKAGARVGIMRKENGNLHFFVNGVDQGVALSNAPFLFMVYWTFLEISYRLQLPRICQLDDSVIYITQLHYPTYFILKTLK